MRHLKYLPIALFLVSFPALAGPEDFKPGNFVPGFGNTALVPDDRLSETTQFKVAFDIAQAGPSTSPNRRLITPARFLNMHEKAGVPAENMSVAIVVHGGAYQDLLTTKARGSENPNAELIRQLLATGARIELCGQTAANYNITDDDVLEGVKISLSAMTSHALLQQEGFTLNPF